MNNTQNSSNISPDRAVSGVIDILPMLLGTAPFGVIFGAYALEMNLGFEGTQGFSIFIFAGSSQFVGASLYGQGTSLIVLAVTTFFINLRHLLYGASLGPRLLNVSPIERLMMSFFLTDESFAIVSRFTRVKARYYWGAALAMYVNWQIWTLIGFTLGSYLKGISSMNLGFVMVPAFLAIIVPQIKNKNSLICCITATGLSILFIDLPHQLGLIIATLSAIFATLLIEYLTQVSKHKKEIGTK